MWVLTLLQKSLNVLHASLYLGRPCHAVPLHEQHLLLLLKLLVCEISRPCLLQVPQLLLHLLDSLHRYTLTSGYSPIRSIRDPAAGPLKLSARSPMA